MKVKNSLWSIRELEKHFEGICESGVQNVIDALRSNCRDMEKTSSLKRDYTMILREAKGKMIKLDS